MTIIRRILAASAVLCFALAFLCAAPEQARANCTTPCTKAQITTDITTNWPDNTTGLITPALLRSTVLDLVNSYVDINGASSFTCSTHQFLTAIATLSSYTCTQPAIADISGWGTGVATAVGIAANTAGGPAVPSAALTLNGVVYGGGSGASPGSTAAGTNDQVFMGTTSSPPGWVSVNNCANALTYNTTTHAWGCNVGAGTGTVTSVVCNGVTITNSGTCPPSFGFQNCSLTASVGSNNLTVALKDNAGSDPSATSPCSVWFRNSTLAIGSWTQVTQTAALSFTANAGSTFGATNTSATCAAAASCPFRLWIVGINTGSGLALGVVDLTNASGVLPLNEGVLQTTTACSACVNATALGTIYSTALQTSKAIVILGYLEWGSGLATAGTYASGPTIIQTMGTGIRKPGEVVQGPLVATSTGTATSTNTTKVQANPSIAITPTSSVNLIRVHGVGNVATSGGNLTCQAEISRSTTFTAPSNANVSVVIQGTVSGTPLGVSTPLEALDAPGTISSTTYVPFLWSSVTANCTWNNTANSGTPSSYLSVEEIMG